MTRRELRILIAKDYIRTLFWKLRPFKFRRMTRGVAVTRLVEERIDAIFDKALRDSAIKLIREQCGMGLPLMHSAVPADYDRIRLAVIKLSGGTIEGLERGISDARNDWRDVLLEAGFGHDVEAHLHWNPGRG